MDFNTVVNSGLSIGVPGTPALWARALRDYGTLSWAEALKPARAAGPKGFVVDQTFHDQTVANAARFSKFPATARVFLPGGQPPAVGSIVHATPTWPRRTGRCARQGVDVALRRPRWATAIVAESRRAAHGTGRQCHGRAR